MSESVLTLPPGWELEDGTTDVAGPQAQAVEAYGGATMNWALDGASIWFLGCCAKKDGGSLMFYIFALRGSVLANVPISGAGTGRGWLDVASDGWMYWSSWEGSSIRPNGPPGRVPEAQRVILSGAPGPQGPAGPKGATGPAGPPGPQGVPGHAVAIPPNGVIASLWTPAYTAAEVDSPEEIAIKLTKNNDMWEELIRLLKQAGVLV